MESVKDHYTELTKREEKDYARVVPSSQTMGLNPQASLQPLVQRCYIRLFTLKISMNHINQSNFIRAKFTRRNRN